MSLKQTIELKSKIVSQKIFQESLTVCDSIKVKITPFNQLKIDLSELEKKLNESAEQKRNITSKNY